MTNNRISLGKQGENLVAEHLKKEGYSICCMNYTRRCGEIDIIAEKDDIRTFVEVKLRTKVYFATSQVVTPSKQRKVIATARMYNCESPPERPVSYRFDVALLEDTGHDFSITYIPNAFTQESEW